MLHKTLLLIYHSHFPTVMSYGIIFLGNSCHSIQIFWLQKGVILLLWVVGIETPVEFYSWKLKILPLVSQYIFPLLVFIVNNWDQFLINSDICNINTRHSSNHLLPLANLGIYQKGVYYSGIKIFNSCPINIKKFSVNPRIFKNA
jgi:hypothetical protein